MNIQEPLHDDLPDLDCEESELIHQSFLESVARENRTAAWRRRRERRRRRRRQGCVSSDSDMEGQNPTMPVQAPPATDDGGSKETTAPRETKSVSTLLLEALGQLVLKPGESLHLQKSAMPNDTATVDDLLAAKEPRSTTTNGLTSSTPITSPTGASGTPESTEKTSNTQEMVKLDPADVGMSAGYKNLYSGKEDKRGRFQWQTTIPEDVGKPAEDAETQKWALLVRNVKIYNDPRKVLSIHSIVVQSPLLKDLLGKVLAGYPGVTVGLQRLEFSGRFEPIIHRWSVLTAAIEQLKQSKVDGTADGVKLDELKHAELLYELLVKEFQSTIDASIDMKNKGVMTYEHLWTLFQPGSYVYSKQEGQDRVFRLSSSHYGHDRDGSPVYWLNCQYIDWDGTRFGTNKLNMCIRKYEGTKTIASLAALPFSFHSEKAELKVRLIERGAKVESFAGPHYRAYNGIGSRLNSMGIKEKYSIKSRIVIDGHGWNKFNPNMAVYVTPLNIRDPSSHDSLRAFDDPLAMFDGGSDSQGGDMYDEYDEGDSQGGMPMDGAFADEEEETAARTPLTDEQKMIMTPLVRGYSLKEKIWLNLFVNAVQDISFNSRAFDSLVLPANQKELILGFTETQQSYHGQFDDVIEGKGRGIILLLCGPPGTGKTLTAESVSEEMNVPLYIMSAGDLGLDPRSVESKLQGVLEICTRWNAILLIDEADVFLTARSLHELERNKLVSIFLRVLEYYEGIMFLTTNRVETFDAAFQSRIHISLEYPELSAESRRTVWTNFLAQHNVAQATARERPSKPLVSAAKSKAIDATNNITNGTNDHSNDDTSAEEEEKARQLHASRTLPHTISKKDLDRLCLMDMNGRQIKNVLKTAQLLASKRGEGLSKKHVTTVLDVTQHLHNATRETDRARSALYH